jgi:hypothetical protein
MDTDHHRVPSRFCRSFASTASPLSDPVTGQAATTADFRNVIDGTP